jgi:hypothetical protein
MASYYKYKSREGEDQIDWRKITQGITDDLTKVAADREGKREAIDQAVLTNLETIADKPQGQDTAQNQLIASYADQASSIALANQKLLKSGAITLKEYTARTNTGGSSTKKLFGLSKKYQENYQNHMDRLKSVDGKPPVGSLLEGAFIQYAEAFSNPDNTRYYMDPATGEAFLAKVSKEGDKGKVQKIDGEAYSLMNVGTAENIITRNVNRYQSAAVANNLADQAGSFLKVINLDGVKPEENAFKRMFGLDEKGNTIETEMSEEVRSVLNQIKATFASDMDYASMLTDTMGKTAIAENADGTYTNIITNQKYDGKPGDAVIFENINGQQQPKQSDNWDKQKKEAEMGVLNQIRTKLDIKETAMPDKEIARANLALRQKELDERIAARKQNGKQTVESTIMADAKSYLEENILLTALEQSDDTDVISSINGVISEFGISLDNPINLIDGQSIRLTQVNEKGEEVTEEILLPSDKSRDILLSEAPNSEAAKQSIITFILENVNARSLSALKNKLKPASQETKPEKPGGAGEWNKGTQDDG